MTLGLKWLRLYFSGKQPCGSLFHNVTVFQWKKAVGEKLPPCNWNMEENIGDMTVDVVWQILLINGLNWGKWRRVTHLNICHRNNDRLAIGLQLYDCGVSGCRMENKAFPTIPHQRFELKDGNGAQIWQQKSIIALVWLL